MTTSATPLLERELELEQIDRRFEAAHAGAGGVLLVEGTAGIGKTELLRAARDRVRASGALVLTATGSELERDIAYGTARQLLEPVVRQADPEEQAALIAGAASLARATLALDPSDEQPSDPFAVLHGLYWLCVNVADRHGALLLSIDDAHWSDPQSLRWIAYLAHRLEELPVLVLAALRPGDSEVAQQSLIDLVGIRLAESIRLEPLGEAATAEVVRARLPEAEAEFCRSCHAATGGNPYLLHELAGTLQAEGVEPTAERGRQITELTSTTVSRYVHLRLARLGDTAVALARALSVLGVAPLRHVAALAEVPLDEATAAVDKLRAADVVQWDETLDFVHPLVRAAIYSDIPLGARRAAHGRAARTLAGDRVDVERVAAQLLASEPAGDPWVIDRLRAAAARALAAGTPDAAVAYLTRALAEPPEPDVRAEVLFALGLAMFPLDPGTAVEHLSAALEQAAGTATRVAIALQLAKALAFSDRPRESVQVLGRLLEQLPESDTAHRLRVERELLGWTHFSTADDRPEEHSRRLQVVAAPLRADTPDEGMMLGLYAWDLVVGDTPAAETLEVAERSLRAGLTFVDPAQGFEIPILIASVFMFCDRLDRALDLFDLGIREMRAQGWLVHLAFAYSHRAHVRLRQGALLDAEADILTSWELASQFGPSVPAWWYSFSNFVQVLVARGQLDRAADLVERSGVADRLPNAVIYPLPRVVLGELRVARGEHAQGAADLMEAGAWLDGRRYTNPAWSGWRMSLAPALAALGRTAEARTVAAEAVRLARRVGAPSTLGRALRVAALLDRDEASIDLLTESVRILESSPAKLEYASSLIEYGAALRRSRHRTESREPLRLGLELAHRCGAQALEERARTELEASGARPRSAFLTGADALTPSERRVCQLAAAGRSNREIAQTLFVTRKTIEHHLASAYRKLGISSRGEIARALAAEG